MSKYLSYPTLFWLFLGCSFLGVIIEGIFCIFRYKRWETHTVTIWGPFCIIYGLGAVGFYIGAIAFENVHIAGRFLLFSFVATVIEYICGLLLKHILHMKAWDYTHEPLNLQGIICIKMTVIWGLCGTVFAQICVPYIKVFSRFIDNTAWDAACAVLSVLMALNLLLTLICVMRWSRRHRRLPARNRLTKFIDRKYGDSKMAKRFCEWKFIDK